MNRNYLSFEFGTNIALFFIYFNKGQTSCNTIFKEM